MLVELQSIERARWQPDEFFQDILRRGKSRSPIGGNLRDSLWLEDDGYRYLSNTGGHKVLDLTGLKERIFEVFDLRIEINANISSQSLNEDVFFYGFARSTASSLRRLSWTGPPHSRVTEVSPIVWGRTVTDGSLIVDISIGAATAYGAIVSYPKFSQGVKAIVSDVANLRKWSLRALEQRKVFKEQKKVFKEFDD